MVSSYYFHLCTLYFTFSSSSNSSHHLVCTSSVHVQPTTCYPSLSFSQRYIHLFLYNLKNPFFFFLMNFFFPWNSECVYFSLKTSLKVPVVFHFCLMKWCSHSSKLTLAFSLSINIMDLNLIYCSLSSICLLVFQVFSTRRSCFISLDAFPWTFSSQIPWYYFLHLFFSSKVTFFDKYLLVVFSNTLPSIYWWLH